jgi:hypothetical protein
VNINTKTVAFINDMGGEQRLSFEPIPGSFEHQELIIKPATPDWLELRKCIRHVMNPLATFRDEDSERITQYLRTFLGHAVNTGVKTMMWGRLKVAALVSLRSGNWERVDFELADLELVILRAYVDEPGTLAKLQAQYQKILAGTPAEHPQNGVLELAVFGRKIAGSISLENENINKAVKALLDHAPTSP